jgi:phosphoribosylformylglycinamidine synthase subunit PurQ / glutaminase
MTTPKVLVLSGYGINCESETLNGFAKQGATGEVVHINDIIDGSKKLEDYQIMAFPGGFSYGDDTGAGNAFSNKARNNLEESILKFAREDKLIIGICNGFQILSNLGLVPAVDEEYGERQANLMWNKTARFECRWVHLKTTSEKCIWTRGIEQIELPMAHGEGNFYTTPEILTKIKENDQIALKYTLPSGNLANGEFPFNPNGAMEDIAGVCDPSGRILGLMPHPERFNSFLNHPNWTKIKEELKREGKEIPTAGAGDQIFKNAVEYFA